MMTRLLVVDGSALTAWLVSRIAPCDVEVIRADSFAQAERILDENAPAAAIFNVTPSSEEWRGLIERCNQHVPPIPFLCTSALDEPELGELGIACRPADLVGKSLPVRLLREKVETLIARARATAGAAGCRPGSTAP